MPTLEQSRRQIDGIDQKIRALFLERMAVAQQVAEDKRQNGGPVYRPEREGEIIARLCQGLEDEQARLCAALMRQVMRLSRETQYDYLLRHQPERFPFTFDQRPQPPRVVCYQGLPGAYSHSAAMALFPEARLFHVQSFDDVFETVAQGRADAGVVPMENSTAGTVNEVYDALVRYQLTINRAYNQPVRHCLAAPAGVSLRQVRTVLSHPQALSQCRRYCQAHGFTVKPCSNTSVAAHQLQSDSDGHTAAICSALAARQHRLTVLEEEIQDLPDNQTRFIAVSPSLQFHPEDDRMSIAFHLPHESGTLSAVLALFASYEYNLTQLHARPLQGGHWEYIFYLDFIGSPAEPGVRALLYQLEQELPYLRITGSYHVREESTCP